MSEKSPRSFDKIEKATIKFQEERYMDSLMGKAVGGNDEQSNKRREEAKEYDAHLGNMDENRKQRDDETFNTEVPSSERDPLLRKIEFVSEQIEKIKNDTHNAKDAIVEKDLASKEALRKDLITKYKNAYGPMHGPKTLEQAVADGEVMHGPEDNNETILQEEQEPTEEDPYRDAILDPENVAALRRELVEDDDQEDVEPIEVRLRNLPDEVAEQRARGGNAGPIEPIPEDEAERPSWYQRNRQRIMGGAALLALAGSLAWASLTEGNRDSDRSGSDEKTEQVDKNPAQGKGDHDKFMSQFKLNNADAHDRNKTVSSGFEQDASAKQAMEQLKKNYGHHPVLLAEAVYSYENGISVDKARQNVDEINKMAKSFTDGDHLTAEGMKWAEKLGKSIDNGSAHWVTQEEMHHSTWYNSGVEEEGTFDKFFINDNAGFNSERILRVTLGNGKVIYYKGNCVNQLWFDDITQSSSSTTTGGNITTTTTDWNPPKIEVPPTVGDPPPKKDTPDDTKGNVNADSKSPADTGGVESKGPGADKPKQEAEGQNSDQTNEQTGGGTSGSTKPADNADQGPKPATPETGKGGETSNGTANE